MAEIPSNLSGFSFLVTGGAGFIGSHIAEELVAKGGRVRVLDNFSTGLRENLSPFCHDVEVIEGDIRDDRTLGKALRGVDYVLHQAAFVSVPLSVQNPALCLDVNIRGLLNLVEKVRQTGVKRLIFASSSSVYGNTTRIPKTERMKPHPISPYGFSKYCGERLLSLYHEIYGIDTVSLRYFNVFGPRQRADSDYSGVISKFIFAHINDRPITIYGDGSQTRDFTFVKDVVKANLLVLFHQGAPGGVFNVGTNLRTSINDLADTISRICGKRVPRRYSRKRPGDIRHSCAAISLISRKVEYRPATGLEEGLAVTLESLSKGIGRLS